jgi:hypothetical protein
MGMVGNDADSNIEQDFKALEREARQLDDEHTTLNEEGHSNS